MLFVARGFRIALLADDGFSKLLAVGLTFAFALQTFIIVGGILRIIPLTGITLPFVSYGGSSVVANFVLLAGLLLVSNRANAERAMNRQITRLALVGVVLLTALIVGTTYWQTWAGASLADRQDNAIQRVAQFTVKRGQIRASRRHDPRDEPDEEGRRPDALLPPVPAGQPVRARRRLLDAVALARRARASQNDYLTGSNANLGTVLEDDARQAQRRDDQGQRRLADASTRARSGWRCSSSPASAARSSRSSRAPGRCS